jgi:(p)ppGpp synthase/HD superfamily hydrolase
VTPLPPIAVARREIHERKPQNKREDGTQMNDLVRLMQAADAAARWHVQQRRKGQAAEPYVNHLLEVANLVAAATEGREPDVVIAALLHDAVEDQGITTEQIEADYGAKVAGIVGEVTDDKSLPKAERKRRQVETAANKSREAKLIKLADKTSNLRAIADSPPPDWSAERRSDYVRWASEVIAKVRGTSPWLERQFDEAVTRAEQSVARR